MSLLIIGGHHRSGTTLLGLLCDSHPDIAVTTEFGCFLAYGGLFRRYAPRLLRRWWNADKPFHSSYAHKSWMAFHNLFFATRYLFKVYKYHWNYERRRVIAPVIETALHGMFPQSPIVGDKWPNYVYLLDRLTKSKGIFHLMIYRDCRDVVSSTLQQARKEWSGKEWVKSFNTAEKVAKRWVSAIEPMEQHADKLHIICYEDLVQQPQHELEKLGQWLGVDAAGFSVHMIKDTSVGKYKTRLSGEELATVMKIAGPTMTRLGYD